MIDRFRQFTLAFSEPKQTVQPKDSFIGGVFCSVFLRRSPKCAVIRMNANDERFISRFFTLAVALTTDVTDKTS